jgi:hypothetical protein
VIGTQCRRHHHNRQNLSRPPHELTYAKHPALNAPKGADPRILCATNQARQDRDRTDRFWIIRPPKGEGLLQLRSGDEINVVRYWSAMIFPFRV